MKSVPPCRTQAYPQPPEDSTVTSREGRAALAYAGRGIPVFRLRPGTKQPFHGSRGFYDATTDLDTVRRWWDESPDANVAYPTGEASGFFVVDEDRAGAIEELERKRGKKLPPR